MSKPKHKKKKLQHTHWWAHRSWVLVGFVLVFGSIGAALLLTSHAATPLQPSAGWTSKSSELVNTNSNLCLGTPGTTKAANGTGYVIETCNDQSDQKWTLTWGKTVTNTTIENGYGQCLDDTGNSTHAGNPMQAWPCSGVVQQTWTTGYGDGTIRIHDLCLGVSNNAKTSGSTIVLVNCNVPAPTLKITTPSNGATLQGTVTVTATASISGDSIASIRLSGGRATLKVCNNTTSCSASWNTEQLSNGSYNITATANGALGGSTTTSETIAVNNTPPSAPNPPPSQPSPPPPPSGGSSGGGTSGGGSSGGSSGTSGSSPSSPSGGPAGNVSGSFNSGANTDTLDTSNGSSNINISGNSSTDSSGTIDNSGASDNSNTSNNPTSNQATSAASNSQPSHKSTGALAAAIVSAILLIAIVVFLFVRRKRQRAHQVVDNPYIAPPAHTGATHSTHKAQQATDYIDPTLPIFPREDSTQTAARLNWWMSDNERAKMSGDQALATHKTTGDNPPDLFEEGRKRLDEEEREGLITQESDHHTSH
ncbi:MAG TPA: ricin-type beta-trefoil lectin domain protein [Verrucomicrobiae bacterium]|nr:ricin-type beta-trefoil lectin domain protein [Verrucomicrobiae bacterium]